MYVYVYVCMFDDGYPIVLSSKQYDGGWLLGVSRDMKLLPALHGMQ